MRFLALVLSLGCATMPPAPPCKPGDALVNATLWTQSAAEYRASALQTYAAARSALDAALASPSTLPPAIILDLDETALDNTGYAARSIRRNTTFQFDANWSAWVAEAASRAVPGSRDFLAYAASRGVTPVYITNRTADMKADTLRNLTTLGFPVTPDTLLLRGERPEWDTTNKTTRRDFVTARYNVILYLGDDLNDFTAANGKSIEERNAIAAAHANDWGTRWFTVANPMYGSWEGSGGTKCEELQKKVDSLRD